MFREGGTGGDGQASFTFAIRDGSPRAVTVPYTLSGISVDDITASSLTGTIIIPAAVAGVSQQTLIVTAEDDDRPEGPETLTVTAQAGTLDGEMVASVLPGSASSATATIEDNPFEVSITRMATDREFRESPLGTLEMVPPARADRAAFTVRIAGTRAPLAALTVAYEVTGQVSAADFVSGSLTGTVTIPAGDMEAPLVLTAANDNFVEGPEALTVTVKAGTSVVPGSPSSATAALDDNDFAVSIVRTDTDREFRESPAGTLEVNPPPGRTGPPPRADQASFTVGLAGAATPAADLTVPYVLTGQVSAADFDPQGLTGTVTIPAGMREAPLLLTAEDDTALEGDETVTVTLQQRTVAGSAVVPVAGMASAQVVLIDDEGPVSIRVSDAAAVEEGSAAEFEIMISRPLAGEIAGLTYTTVDDTAVGGAAGDYTAAQAVAFTIPANTVRTTLSIPTRDDGEAERDAETFSLRLGGRAAGGVARQRALRPAQLASSGRARRRRSGTTTCASPWSARTPRAGGGDRGERTPSWCGGPGRWPRRWRSAYRVTGGRELPRGWGR